MISIARMKPTANGIKDCARHLDRIATALELILLHGYNISVPTHNKPDAAPEEGDISYTDDEKEWMREYLADLKKEPEEIDRIVEKMEDPE